MKTTIEPDRIRLQSETEDESQAILIIGLLVAEHPATPEDISNDHGSTGELNYCTIPQTPHSSH